MLSKNITFLKFSIIIICILGAVAFILNFTTTPSINRKEEKYSSKIKFPNRNIKMAYISTWDDTQNIDSYIRIDKLCKERNLAMPLTLFISSAPKCCGSVLQLTPEVIDKYKTLLNGPVKHTIESHGVTHSGDPHIPHEYIQSQKDLRKIFGEQYAKTFCFPFGNDPNKKNIINILKKHYLAARDVDKGFVDIKKLYDLDCFQVEKIEEKHIKKAIKHNYAMISYGHGIKEIGGWNPISEKDFIKHLKILKKYESNIWFVTLPDFIEFLKKSGQI